MNWSYRMPGWEGGGGENYVCNFCQKNQREEETAGKILT